MSVMMTIGSLPRHFAPVFCEGDLRYCAAHVDGAWPTPDLQAFMDLIPVADLLRLFEKARFWLHRNTRAQATFQRGMCDVTRIMVTRPA